MPVFTTAVRCLEEIARQGSIRRAADKLNLTPSAVNRQILALEQELKTQLFERLPRGMRLTSAGEILRASLRRQEQDFHAALSQVEALKGMKLGHVVLASLSHFAPLHLTRFIASFRAEYAGVSFSVLAGSSGEVIRWVVDGVADIGICFEPGRGFPVDTRQAIPVRFGAIVPAGHALASRQKVRVRDCLNYPLVLPVEGMESRTFAEQLGLARWPDRIVAVETSSFSMVIELIKAGVGVGFLTDVDAAVDVAAGTLAFIPLMDAGVPTPKLCTILRARRTLPFATAVVLERLGKHLDTLAAETKRQFRPSVAADALR